MNGRLPSIPLLALALSGCAAGPDTREARWGGPLDDERALAIVAEAVESRAHPNPHLDQPTADRRILSIDVEKVVFQRLESGAPVETLWFRDVTSVTTRSDDSIPSRPESIQVHVAAGSESARSTDVRSDLLTYVGVGDPHLEFPGRDRRLGPYFRRALEHLRGRAPAGSRSYEAYLDDLEAEERARDREAEARARQEERIRSLVRPSR